MFTENPKLTNTQKLTLSSSILVMYPCLKQGEFAYQDGQPEAGWKHPQDEKLPLDQMQSISQKEIEHF